MTTPNISRNSIGLRERASAHCHHLLVGGNLPRPSGKPYWRVGIGRRILFDSSTNLAGERRKVLYWPEREE